MAVKQLYLEIKIVLDQADLSMFFLSIWSERDPKGCLQSTFWVTFFCIMEWNVDLKKVLNLDSAVTGL
ncbi:hypothetical protein A0U96_05065 [Lactiplantibacillus plantarum]|nr:hypothetical protein A0U96_05065 [Lactiplantibacillus plantarum]RDG10124.1 hypothetical protein DQM08_11670 [Lactiplantibacillus paraplantarum]